MNYICVAIPYDTLTVTEYEDLNLGGCDPTCCDVSPVDPDVLVPVSPCVFMVEAQCVEELVLNDPTLQTTVHGQRNHLPAALFADGGPASVQGSEKQNDL